MAKKKRSSESKHMTPEDAAKTIGKGLSFGAAEAYKLLRTNLTFSLPDTGTGKIIGVTSSLRGEGKSTTAINLAYTIAETGKMVLLIEGDMRLPVLAKRLPVKQTPGLSNLLAGQSSGNEVLQNSGLLSNMKVISAGAIPPNPAELLESSNMEQTLKMMRNHFDVVVVDLPPLMAVSDALTVAKFLDGLIMVCRQDYCDKRSLDESIKQIQFTQTKLLGFVMTGSNQQSKYYYNRYGKRYGYGRYRYGYGYGRKGYGYYRHHETDDDPANA